jgi:hypothetical protein
MASASYLEFWSDTLRSYAGFFEGHDDYGESDPDDEPTGVPITVKEMVLAPIPHAGCFNLGAVAAWAYGHTLAWLCLAVSILYKGDLTKVGYSDQSEAAPLTSKVITRRNFLGEHPVP